MGAGSPSQADGGGISGLGNALRGKEKIAVKHRWLAALALVAAAVPMRAAPAEKTPVLTGVVEEYSAAQHRFVVKDEAGRQVAFTWTRDTKFNGVVATGAKVTVRYTPQDNSPNIAQTVGIVK
jgi:hypothetical protein